ncbi:MAG TPA: T9SS type A sorting domain-containing protein [Parafilimonas sp.]|nr:T9SS type A sorting domain-containing protein [Parafilimonas sp.]
MKPVHLFLSIFLLTNLNGFAQVWEWAKAEPNDIEGNTSLDYDDAHHSAVDASGNLYVLGDYNDSLYLNGIYRTKGNGSYLAKYNPAGNLLWYILIRADDPVYNRIATATDIVVNNNGIYITGFLPQPLPSYSYSIGGNTYNVDTSGYNNEPGLYANQFYFCRLDFNGNVKWNKISRNAFINSSLSHPSLASDNNGNLIVSGIMGRNSCCNEGPRTFYLGTDAITDTYAEKYNYNTFSLKYKANGNLIWSRFAHTLGGTIQDADYIEVLSTACDNANNLWLYMRMIKSVKFGNIVYTTDAITGDQTELIIGKMSPSGNWQLIKEVSTYASVNGNKNSMITADGYGNIYVLTNLIRNYGDAYLNGNILIPYSPYSDHVDMYLLKYNSNATLLWYKNFGSDFYDYANSIIYSDNTLYISGSLYSYPGILKYKFSSLTVPNNTYAGPDGYNYFISKVDTSGNFVWVNLLRGYYAATSFSSAIYNDNIYSSGTHYGGILNLGHLTPGYTGGFEAPFTGKLKDQYIRVGAVTPTSLIPGCTITIPFTSYGLTFSNKNKFVAELSDANGDFAAPTSIGNVKSTGTGSITGTIPKTLPFGTTGYRIRIRSSDTLKTGFNYYAYADTGYVLSIECSPAPAGLTATNITTVSARLNWNIVPCASGYKIQYRLKGTTAWATLQVKTNTGSVDITGLTANATYQWRAATKCKAAGITAVSSFTSIKQFNTPASFAVMDVNTSAIKTGDNALHVYPNPAMSNIHIAFAAERNCKVEINITDALGRQLYQHNTINTGTSFAHNINVSRFQKGVYIINVITGKEVRKEKFIKE